MKILCIDDDRTFLTMFEKVLRKHALPDDEILVTLNPEEGITTVAEQKIDIVITDLVMPGINGLEVLKKIKELDDAVEVIVVTGQGSIDSAVEAMRLGARDYLTKPLNHGMLIGKIQNIREFIERAHEAEDYRHAKETVESNAFEAVAEMEVKLEHYFTLVDNIKQVAVNDIESDEKIAEIRDYIGSVEEQM